MEGSSCAASYSGKMSLHCIDKYIKPFRPMHCTARITDKSVR
jgi:hypothetical protein